ncbi:MAG TPA: sigma-54 dependent transcriptional regulator [Terriglobales bacterium]|nr:sigma-54 dependent transcriptional regulator [Terriglobales bacterium]
MVGKETASVDLLAGVAMANAWHLESADSGWDALERVQSGARPNLVLLDLGRENGDGLHMLRWLRRVRPELPVLVLAYSHDISQKTEAIRLGAQEYLVRPLIELQLEDAIKRHLPSTNAESDFEDTSEEVEEIGEGRIFIAASPAMHRLRAQADLLAQLDVPLLIVGEGGSGKETLARLIHKLSVRSGFRFMKVNCAALGGELLENELFGSLASGTRRSRPGKFELCQQGTILLDKISEIPHAVQARLLRILEEKQLASGHGEGGGKSDVRVIATSNVNVEAALADHTLRQDLYFHLSAFTMHIAPLRNRRSEVPLLLGHFMNQLARHYGLEPTPFSPTLVEVCEQYAWPGNLKQMESFVKRYLVTRDEEAAMGELQSGIRVAAHAFPAAGDDIAVSGSEEPSGDRNSGLKSLVQTVKGEAERNAILTALEQTQWNRRAAARLLQVSYRTLLYKIQQYNMTPVRFLSPVMGSNGTKGNGHGR